MLIRKSAGKLKILQRKLNFLKSFGTDRYSFQLKHIFLSIKLK